MDPDNLTLAQKIGMQTQASQPFYDLIIIGAGPAGLGAGVYGASEGLRTIMIEHEATGGQAGTSSRIENYLGFHTGISGSLLAERATIQAKRLGAEVLTAQEVSEVRVEDPYRIVKLNDGTELSCHALIVATGVTTRRLDAPGIDRLTGAGVYYGAAVTEAAALSRRACLRGRRRQLSRAGRHVFLPLCQQSDHPGARQQPGKGYVPIPGRPDRIDRQHRSAHAHSN